LDRLSVTCDFCHSSNELTLSNVAPEQQVTCSVCGGLLGSLAQLRNGDDKGAEPGRPLSTKPGSFVGR
jgi:hypothetical protein